RDVFHLDSFWQRALMWCDFEWDSARIPDPKQLLAELPREGFHNGLWINPYVSLQTALYREGAWQCYFLPRPDRTVSPPVVWSQPSPDLFVRWAQAGFLSGLSRYHGATAREPWRFGDEALRIFRQYARLRSRLVPYLVAYGWQASEDGVPLMRPMVMEFPDDPAGYAFDLQYCLGRELLVSPVVRADGWVTTYLPRARWP